jgi:energy-coupling factor transport system permease protein
LARLRSPAGVGSEPAERRTRRALHPLAWWAWALALAAAALRTTNPALLALLIGVVAWVVASRRTTAPWARAFGLALRLGAVLIVFRVVLAALFALRLPGTVLVTLPSIEMPAWAAGVTVGGPVTVELLAQAGTEGLRLAAMIACVGAANALASPYRLLRSLPAVLYEAGVAATVALSFTPQVVTQIGRLRDARRLRGRKVRGVTAVRGIALPVLEGGLERAVTLAESMDARGYGRRAGLDTRTRRLAAGATLGGMLGLAVGMYAVLDAGAPQALGLPVLVVGSASLVAGMAVAGRRAPRTRHRPDPWTWPEWIVVASGLPAAVVLAVLARRDPGALALSTSPLAWPSVPAPALLGILAALVAGVAAPRPPVEVDPRHRAVTSGGPS